MVAGRVTVLSGELQVAVHRYFLLDVLKYLAQSGGPPEGVQGLGPGQD